MKEYTNADTNMCIHITIIVMLIIYIYIEIKTLGHPPQSRAVCEATGLGYSSALSGTSLNTPLVH